jgi:hypothetical protein
VVQSLFYRSARPTVSKYSGVRVLNPWGDRIPPSVAVLRPSASLDVTTSYHAVAAPQPLRSLNCQFNGLTLWLRRGSHRLLFKPTNDLFCGLCVRSSARSTRMTNLLEQAISTDGGDRPPRSFRTPSVLRATRWRTIAFPDLGRATASNGRGSLATG